MSGGPTSQVVPIRGRISAPEEKNGGLDVECFVRLVAHAGRNQTGREGAVESERNEEC
jgi:hypothetical protein